MRGRPDEPGLILRAMRALGRRLEGVPRGLAGLVCAAWMVLIWSLSAQSPVVIVERSPWASVLTNLAHAPEFGLLCLWLLLAGPRVGGHVDASSVGRLRVLAGVLAYAIVDELHQSYVPGRDASIFDIGTDLAGAWLVLRLVRATIASSSTSREVWNDFAASFALCILCAVLASFVPHAFPDITWL